MIYLPAASGLSLVVAAQKDNQYMESIRERVVDLLTRLLGGRLVNLWENEILYLLAPLAYFAPSAVSRRSTLGEEHSEILPFPPFRNRLLGALLISTCGQYIFLRLFPRGKAIFEYFQQLHLAIFYVAQKYRDFGKRVVGIFYVSIARRILHARDSSSATLSFLGILLFVQLLVQLRNAMRKSTFQAILTSLRRLSGIFLGPKRQLENITCISDENPFVLEQKSVLFSNSSNISKQGCSAPECTLCLGPRQFPTATLCGHIFCWDCVLSLCSANSGNAQCPLCRQPVQPQHLAPISSHYEPR